MAPDLSIIVPVLNDVRIGRALDSIIAQNHDASLEIIVVDGGSSQPTLDEIEKRSSHISELIQDSDDGIYDAMNKGIEVASGAVVGNLNADDRYPDTKVFDRILRNMDDDSIGACYGNLIYVGDEGKVTREWYPGENARYKWRLGWMPPHPTFFVRNQLYSQFGSFRTELEIAADYELMLRFSFKHRVKLGYINAANVHMTPGGHSTRNLKNIVLANLEVRRAWKMNGLKFGTLAPILKPLRSVFQLKR